MTRPNAAALLALRFLWAVFTSGIQTARVIARGRRRPPAALVRMRFAPMSATGAALLGCLVTLTPGTTTIDVDMERRELLLHVLDSSEVEDAIASIREHFERCVVALFGTETS
jgi:multicomponent K+:H+ antiporter subunit E/multicomponent Na+:H+ antiporter subunit E